MKRSILRATRHPMPWVFLFFLVLPYLLPLVGGYTYLGVEVLIWSIFALGFNILLGYTGLPSFGHGAFFGIGAFALGIVQLRLVQGMWIPILAGTLAGAFFGALVGLFLAKKRGIYFALLTIAFSQMFWFVSWGWDSMTGGEDGLAGINRLPIGLPGLFGIDMENVLHFYYFVYFLFILCTLLIWIIVHSPFGRTLQAIRYNEVRAGSIGYNIALYKWISFTLSCAFSGLAGSLYALLRNAAFSDVMHWTQSGNVIMMVLLGGGLTNFFGPILGSGVFIVLRDLFSAHTEHWLLIYGLLFMCVIIFIPEGILSLFKKKEPVRESLISGKKQ
ncbi:MAG TPA: branched-chain amino acid ABC transporter permease [Candidatus Methylomirabilis sp.]